MSIQLPFKAQVQQHDISIRFHHNNIQQHIFVKPSSSKTNTTFDQQTTVHGLAGPGAIQCTQPKLQCFPISFPAQPTFARSRFTSQTSAFAPFYPHSLAFARIGFTSQTFAFALFCRHSPTFASTAAPPKEEFEKSGPTHRHRSIRAVLSSIVCIYVPKSKVIISRPALNTAENGEHNEVAKQMFDQKQIFQYGLRGQKIVFFKKIFLKQFSEFCGLGSERLLCRFQYWEQHNCRFRICGSDTNATPNIGSKTSLASERPMFNSVPQKRRIQENVAFSPYLKSARPMWNSAYCILHPACCTLHTAVTAG